MGILNNFYTIITSPYFYVPSILAIIVIVFGNLFKVDTQKVMVRNLFSFGGIDVDWWSISHILLYMYFGYFFPEYFFEFLIIGAIWEGIEMSVCKVPVQKIMNCSNSDNFICDLFKDLKNCDYWYSKIDDILMNSIGFIIGALIAKSRSKSKLLV